MRFGLSVPNFGRFADVKETADLARRAEESGWDGFFVWDHIQPEFGPANVGIATADPWVLLTAIALATSRIRIGPMITPIARRRPWKLARETTSLDQVSDGRLVLGVGLGFPPDTEFERLGEPGEAHVRAGLLDEGLDVLTGLWSGESFSYAGRHFTITDATFQPTPVQQPRIPIWVAGMWPNRGPFRRAARFDGAFPLSREGLTLSPDDVRACVDFTMEHRTAAFDVVVGAELTGDRPRDAEMVGAYADAGATWIIDMGSDDVETSIRRGPPD